MSEVIALRGIPASGKSTWARELAASHPDGHVARINNDDLVAGLFPNAEGRIDGLAPLLGRMRAALLSELLRVDTPIIVIDNTNLDVHSLRKLEHRTVEAGHAFTVLDDHLAVPVDECIARDARRLSPVGEPVIRKMARTAAKLKPWAYSSRSFLPVVQNPALRHCVIFDIDGTLAHKHPDRDIYDGSLAYLDTPDPAVAAYAKYVHDDPDTDLVVVTGRDGGKYGGITRAWLDVHIAPGLPLFMRPADDPRRDSIIKREILEEQILPRWFVRHAIDDRNQVTHMWRQSGIVAWQVCDGDY